MAEGDYGTGSRHYETLESPLSFDNTPSSRNSMPKPTPSKRRFGKPGSVSHCRSQPIHQTSSRNAHVVTTLIISRAWSTSTATRFIQRFIPDRHIPAGSGRHIESVQFFCRAGKTFSGKRVFSRCAPAHGIPSQQPAMNEIHVARLHETKPSGSGQSMRYRDRKISAYTIG